MSRKSRDLRRVASVSAFISESIFILVDKMSMPAQELTLEAGQDSRIKMHSE
jgi:hypothetical protein